MNRLYRCLLLRATTRLVPADVNLDRLHLAILAQFVARRLAQSLVAALLAGLALDALEALFATLAQLLAVLLTDGISCGVARTSRA